MHEYNVYVSMFMCDKILRVLEKPNQSKFPSASVATIFSDNFVLREKLSSVRKLMLRLST